MSTKATVAYQAEDGTYRATIIGHDGYPEWLGKMLLTHFDIDKNASRLVNAEYISAIKENGDFNGKDGEARIYQSAQALFAAHRDNANDYLYVWRYADGGGWWCEGFPLAELMA